MTIQKLVRLSDVCRQDRTSVKAGQRAELAYMGLESIESNTGRFKEAGLSKTPEVPLANSLRFGPEQVLYGKLRPYLHKVALAEFEGKCSTEIIPLLPSQIWIGASWPIFYAHLALSPVSQKIPLVRGCHERIWISFLAWNLTPFGLTLTDKRGCTHFGANGAGRAHARHHHQCDAVGRRMGARAVGPG